MVRAAVAAAALVLASCAGLPGEGGPWGRFQGSPTGRFVEAEPWNLFELSEDFTYEAPDGTPWTATVGSVTDGATIPPILWSAVGGPYEGRYFFAAVIHDHYVGTKERASADTHRAFYTGMRSRGVLEAQAKLMYWAVLAFSEDWAVAGARNATLPAVDFADRAERALALSKFAAVARTLETTGGAILDVLPSGNVSADLASLEANARFVRTAIAGEGGATLRRAAPPDLGLGAAWEGIGPGAIEPWPGGALPRYDALPTLAESPGAEAFVLDDPSLAAERQAAALSR